MPTDSGVVAICGSRRAGSHTRVALRTALDASAAVGAETDFFDLRELDVPPFDPGAEPPADVDRLSAALLEADAILLGTPMYHGSYSGVLKNAIDHCGFDEFGDRTVGLLAVSGGSFPISALEHLHSVCRALNAWVLPYQAAIPNVDDAVEDGRLVEEKYIDRVQKLGSRVVQYASIEPQQDAFEGEQNVGAGAH